MKNLPLMIFLLIPALARAVGSSADNDAHWGFTGISGASQDGEDNYVVLRKCDGLVGECMDQSEEMLMESDITRRILAHRTRYISYGALLKDRVPCNRRGHSYYNCARSGRANPYKRGCSVITHCYRYTH